MSNGGNRENLKLTFIASANNPFPNRHAGHANRIALYIIYVAVTIKLADASSLEVDKVSDIHDYPPALSPPTGAGGGIAAKSFWCCWSCADICASWPACAAASAASWDC